MPISEKSLRAKVSTANAATAPVLIAVNCVASINASNFPSDSEYNKRSPAMEGVRFGYRVTTFTPNTPKSGTMHGIVFMKQPSPNGILILCGRRDERFKEKDSRTHFKAFDGFRHPLARIEDSDIIFISVSSKKINQGISHDNYVSESHLEAFSNHHTFDAGTRPNHEEQIIEFLQTSFD